MTDERMGLTSASNALPDLLCPGRHQAQRGLPEQESDDAKAGTRLHALYAGEIPIDQATPEEQATVEGAWETDDKALLELRCRLPVGELKESFREMRLWMAFGSLEHSGKPDYVRLFKGTDQDLHALIGDAKMLWGEHDAADINQQLRDYAVLVAANSSFIVTVSVYLNQPRKRKSFSLVTYNLQDLANARREMSDRIAASNAPDAPRKPGPVQCKFCRAKLTCSEFITMTTQTLPVSVVAKDKATPDDIKQATMQLPAERLASLLHYLPMMEACVSALKAEAKQRLKVDSASVPGWRLGEGRERRTVEDIGLVWSRVAALGVDNLTFTQACSIGIADLKKLVSNATAQRGKTLDATVAGILEGAVTVKTTEGSLEEAK